MEEENLRRSLERLVRLGRTPDVDIRPVLLRVLVDMFCGRAHHTPGDLAQFEDMIGRLLNDADAEVRASVAARLADHPAVPPSLLRRFVDEGGDVAAAVLRRSEVERDALLNAALWGTASAAEAVAQRRDLSPDLVAALIERPEPEILLAVASNAEAPLDRDAFRYLVRRARGDEALGRALLARNTHQAECAPLFLLADAEQRAAIVLAARRDDLGPEPHMPQRTADEAAALLRLERSLLAPDRDGFDVALADALGSRLDDVWRILDDPRGEPLALALAAIGASAELAARVFILSGPAIGQSVMAVRKLTALVEAVPRRTAARLIAGMTHAALRVPDGRTNAADASSRSRRDDDRRSSPRAPAPLPEPVPARRVAQG